MTHVQEWKTALSTAKTDEESFRFFLKNGISAVEISMRWDLYAGIDWPAVQSSADVTGMELWSLHLPFSGEINIASPDEKCRRHAVQVHCGLIEKGAAIGITRYVVHPSAEPIADEERPAWMNAAKKSLS